MPVYSHSRLSAFENCPLQYRFRYIDRIRTEFESIEAFMGKKVHETLEDLYSDLDRARGGGVEGAVGAFHRLWERGLTPAVQVIRPDMMADDYRAIGERCLRTFWEENYPFRIDPGTIIGLELKVDIALDRARQYRMMGYVDRAQHAGPGIIEIHDYKTSASLPREGSLQYDRQLPLYEMGLRQRFPETSEVRLIWHFLAHAKTFVEIRTREQLDRIRKSCIALIQTVEKTRDFPSKKGPLCAWCSYQEICPEWKDEKPVARPAFPGGRSEEAGAIPDEGGSMAAPTPAGLAVAQPDAETAHPAAVRTTPPGPAQSVTSAATEQTPAEPAQAVTPKPAEPAPSAARGSGQLPLF